MATSGVSKQLVTTEVRPLPRVNDAVTSLRHRYSDRYMLTYLITFRLPSTSGVTGVRGVFRPASVLGKAVQT